MQPVAAYYSLFQPIAACTCSLLQSVHPPEHLPKPPVYHYKTTVAFRSNVGHTVVSMLIDVNGFYAYDQRESYYQDGQDEEEN